MTSYTPNLNLLKKDPSTDGNDTFNITTMLNDNWDKIDEKVAKLKKTIKIIETSQTWTVPSGVYEVLVFLIGGGASGAMASSSGNGGNGGGGGFATTEIIKVIPGETIPITIGAGGVPSTRYISATSGGGVGGESSFGKYLTCAGGGMIIGNTDNGASVSHGGAGGGSFLDGHQNGGSGLGDNCQGTLNSSGLFSDANGRGLGGKAFCRNYKGAFCPMTKTLYGGGGGAAIGSSGATIGGLGGDGGGGAGGWNQEGHYNGQDGQLYGAGGGGCYYRNTPGSGHAGVCIIAY